MNKEKEYELVVIGGGPAGLTAGLYASRARLDCLLIEKGLVGGQIANAEQVDNYPGFPDGVGMNYVPVVSFKKKPCPNPK